MKHEVKSVTQSPDNDLGGVGEWIASLLVWLFAIAVSLAIVCVYQSGEPLICEARPP